MFIVTLFTIARTWKQPKYSSTEEQTKKMWYIYTMEYYSAIKRNEIVPFAEMCMDLETVIQSEVGQKEKNKCCVLTHICGITYRKIVQMNLLTKAKTETQTQRLMLASVMHPEFRQLFSGEATF